MTSLNYYLFLLINAGANPPQWAISLATFIARDLAFITLPMLAVMLYRPAWRQTAWKAVAAVALAMLITTVIRYAIPMPRPFVVGIGHTWLHHAPDPSFPSNHGTYCFSFALALLCWLDKKGYGVLLFLIALAIAWSRVYLGVHFPLDMLGGLIVGGVSCLIVQQAWQCTIGRRKAMIS